jgi:hypothetical protein
MLGKSVGVAALVAGIFLALSCAHNVGQDEHTGEDGRPKGAKELTLDNGEAKAKGIVTYPGGDRVDWKFIQLPDGQKGTLDIKLQWTPPRPGLQLAFDVFNEYGVQLGQSKRAGKRSKSRVRTTSVVNAKGKLFLRVYAVSRGDAGAYKLTVDYTQNVGAINLDLTKVDVPDPPKLAAVPEAEVPCDEFTFDIKNPACRSICPTANAPPGWPACKGKCPDPPDVNNSACWATMPCPNPPDRRVRACPKAKWPKCLDINNPDPNNPNCDDATAPPVTARVIKNEVQGADTVITVAAGTDQGVGTTWTGHVLRGDSETPLDGGDVHIFRCGKRECAGRVHLTTDTISNNPRVKLTPPPK